MAVQTYGSKIEEILGDEAAALLQHQCKTIPEGDASPARARTTSSASTACPIGQTRGADGSLQSLLDHGRLAGTGYVSILPVDQGIEHSAGASFAPNPVYFDPENIVKLAIEGGLQRGGVDARRAGIGRAEVRAQDSVPAEAQPQRVPLVSERVRSDQVRERAAGVRHGRAGASARRSTSGQRSRSGRSGSDRDVPAGARARHVHGALVLPAEPGVQDEGQGLPRGRRPHRPGESSRRDDRGRHHQAEAAGEQRRLQRASISARRTRRSTRSCRPIIRSI